MSNTEHKLVYVSNSVKNATCDRNNVSLSLCAATDRHICVQPSCSAKS